MACSFIYTRKGIAIAVDEGDLPELERSTWSIHSSGHVRASRNGSRIYLHRLLTGASPGQAVDHIDGNPLNNRRSNLRLCSRPENNRNRKVQSNSKLGVKGVSLTSTGRYRAAIGYDSRQHHLGYFDTLEDARDAYNTAALKHHGAFARLT